MLLILILIDAEREAELEAEVHVSWKIFGDGGTKKAKLLRSISFADFTKVFLTFAPGFVSNTTFTFQKGGVVVRDDPALRDVLRAPADSIHFEVTSG